MPLLTLHLLRLRPSHPAPAFLKALQSDTSIRIALASKVQHTVIAPTRLDANALVSQPWDVLLLLHTPNAQLPAALRPAIAAEYKVFCGIPSKLMQEYPGHNRKIRAQAPPAQFPSLDAAMRATEMAGGERLELSPELLTFMAALEKSAGPDCPVTMLNLLHFHPDGGEASYLKYGAGFREVAGPRGGDPKIVGHCIPGPSGAEADARGDRPRAEWWQQLALVHYPR